MRARPGLKRIVASLAAVAVTSLAAVADATITSVLGGAAHCIAQVDGQRHCAGIFTSFDGAPIDVNVGFPPVPASGPDGSFPIVGIFHGWGAFKIALTDSQAQEWLDAGYAVFSMSDRGWGASCGGLDPKRLLPGVCDEGYIRLLDTRFEVRDAQEVFERLADQPASGSLSGQGLIDPKKIAAIGGSYGGALAIGLAALKSRKMLPDGSLVPWVSPGGKAMQIAAAQPHMTWTDLAYSLLPNGHTLDYVRDAPYLARGRIGVMKRSYISHLYTFGLTTGHAAPAGSDPDADLATWYAAIDAGEPYDTSALVQDLIDEVTTHHSSYYIDDGTAPAPLLISNGWTDDLFPPDEAIRFYNRTRTNHPGTPIALLFADFGHARTQNKAADLSLQLRERRRWIDFYVRGIGAQPHLGVQALTTTCGGPSVGATGDYDDPSSDRPFAAPTWATLAPGEIRFAQAPTQTIAPGVASDGPVGRSFDPIAGATACAEAPAADQVGTATYRFDSELPDGFTLMGSPTIILDVTATSASSQIAARLLDVDPANDVEKLIARGLFRPAVDAASVRQVFQLHPNAWKVAPGHVVKLELLPADQPYGRSSNDAALMTVANLELRLPVVDEPGCGLVKDPAPKVVPPGYTLAPDYAALVDGSRCAACPLDGCKLPIAPHKGALAIKNKPGVTADRLQWSWAAGAATRKADFANPVATTTGYTFCVYDGNGDVVGSARAAGGGICGTRPCWSETKRGYKYRGGGGALQVVLSEGASGKAKISLTQKAAGIPPLPLTQAARVQLVNGAGTCWEATYGSPARENVGERFKDKND